MKVSRSGQVQKKAYINPPMYLVEEHYEEELKRRELKVLSRDPLPPPPKQKKVVAYS